MDSQKRVHWPSASVGEELAMPRGKIRASDEDVQVLVDAREYQEDLYTRAQEEKERRERPPIGCTIASAIILALMAWLVLNWENLGLPL
jgi:Cys-tRNA synthase (O-phospho-L-seryl-tRNA:Cys-tRNA synthase)